MVTKKPNFFQRIFRFGDTNGYNAYDPNANPKLFPSAAPTPENSPSAPNANTNPNDPLLDVMNATGQNPARPPFMQNYFIHKFPLGSQGSETYAGYPREEYLHELFGKDRAKIFDKMRRSDSQIKMLLSSVKNQIKGAVWEVEAADPDDPESVAQADLIRHILLDEMPGRGRRKGFTKFLGEALSMCDFGHSVFEKTYKLVTDHPKFGTYHGIASLDLISAKTIYRWNVDPDGNLISVTQIAIGDLHRYVNIPSEFLMTFSIDQEGANYEGISLLRPCYGNWLRKNLALKLNAIGIEKFAVPTPVVTYPKTGFQNTQQFDSLIAALEVYTSGQSNYLTKPDGVNIEMVKNTYDPEKVDKTIDAEDRRMTKAFLANFLELGANGKGSFALSEDLSDFFLAGLENIATEICEGINSDLIPELCNLNFGQVNALPKLKHSGITDKAGEELARVLMQLASAKVIIPDDQLEEHVRKRYNLSKKTDQGQRIDQNPAPSGGGGSGMGGGGGGKSLSERVMRKLYGSGSNSN